MRAFQKYLFRLPLTKVKGHQGANRALKKKLTLHFFQKVTEHRNLKLGPMVVCGECFFDELAKQGESMY